MGAECSKLRQLMRAIVALSRAQLLLIVVTRSRDLSRECHVTKHKTPARSNFPMSNFENSATIQFSSSRSTSKGLCPKNLKKGRTMFKRNKSLLYSHINLPISETLTFDDKVCEAVFCKFETVKKCIAIVYRPPEAFC